jgi:site-specific recombinase XerD
MVRGAGDAAQGGDASTRHAFDSDDRLLTTDEVAELLAVSRSFIVKVRSTGAGPDFIEMGDRVIRYKLSKVIEWRDAREVRRNKEPRSKLERLVLTERLVEAGMTLVTEALEFAKNDLACARGLRNGLMVALLAFRPIRLKNFAALEIGSTFRQVHGAWWIALPCGSTKSRRPDERTVPALLNPAIDAYLNKARPFLLGSAAMTNQLWISFTRRRQLTAKNLGTLISKITLETVGVDVSPHLFRTAAASTAATYGANVPHLASALLNHTDPRITEEHYNRATSMSAAQYYAALAKEYREGRASEASGG